MLSAFIKNKNLENKILERQRDRATGETERATGETEREQLQLRLLNAEGLLNMRGAFGKNGFSGG